MRHRSPRNSGIFWQCQSVMGMQLENVEGSSIVDNTMYARLPILGSQERSLLLWSSRGDFILRSHSSMTSLLVGS